MDTLAESLDDGIDPAVDRLDPRAWRIVHDNGTCWLRPPPAVDPEQKLIHLPSKNPLMLDLRHDDDTE